MKKAKIEKDTAKFVKEKGIPKNKASKIAKTKAKQTFPSYFNGMDKIKMNTSSKTYDARYFK